MTESVPSCSEGWDPAEILAYMEGDLDPGARAELEAHLRTCEACAAELASLQRMDTLLRQRTLAFHPDEEALQRFVVSGEDRDGKIAAHLSSCDACAEDVELLREMTRLGSEVAEPRPTMPPDLVRRIERLHPAQTPESLPARLVASVREFFSLPFRLPTFALGTAVAVAILIVVVIPRGEKRIETPQSGPKALFEQPVPQAEPKAGSPSRNIAPIAGGPPVEAAPPGKAKDADIAQDRMAAAPQPLQKPAAPAAEADKVDSARSAGLKPDERVARQEAAPGEAKKGESVRRERRAFSGSLERQAPAASAPARQEPAKTSEYATPRKKAKPTPSLPASAEKETAMRQSRLQEAVETRIPVTLRLMDADGREISWIKPVLPPALESRYRLTEARDGEQLPADGERAPGKAAGLSFSDSVSRAIPLLIQLRQYGDTFDLDAKRIDPSSGRETKRIEAIGVPRADLQDRIHALVASLLE